MLRAAAGRPVLATPVLREEERTPYVAPPPRVMGNRNTGTMARVGNTQRRRASTWVLVALSLLGLLAVVALGAGIYLANHTPTATVPNLTGSSPEGANGLLSQAKLIGKQQPVTSDSCTRGTVIHQDPMAGKQVPEGTAVTLRRVPGPGRRDGAGAGLLGKDKAAVDQALKAAGLVPQYQTTDSDKPKDQVVDPEPGGGLGAGEGQQRSRSPCRWATWPRCPT